MFSTYLESIDYKHKKITDINNDTLELIYKYTIAENIEDINVYYNAFEQVLKENNDTTYENYEYYNNTSYSDMITISNKLTRDEYDNVPVEEKHWCDNDTMRYILDKVFDNYVKSMDISTCKKIISLYGFDKALNLYIYYQHISTEWYRQRDIEDYCKNINLDENSDEKLREIVLIIFKKRFDFMVYED